MRKSIIRRPARSSTGRRGPDPRAALRRNRKPERLPRYLSKEDVARFLQAVARGGNSRDLAIFGLMYWYGLRAIELTLLQREDLDLTRRRIRITRAKGGVTAEYVLEDENLVRVLKRYLRQRIDRGPYLFTGRESTNQRGVRELTVRRLFKSYAAAAGLPPKAASHALRHSIAVHLLEGKESLAAVAILLGHKQLRSSEVYAKITEPAREGLLQRMKKNPAIVSVPRPR